MKHPRSQLRSRRGTAYVMVLAISLLVSVIGVAALTALRVQIRSSDNTNDCEEARIYAQSGLEVTRGWINNDPNWRTNRTSGGSVTLTLGSGSITVSAIDPVDGDFTNSPLDVVQLTSIGFKGRARQALQVTLAPAPVPYTCLNSAICSNGAMSVISGKLATAGVVASNNAMSTSSGSVIDANAEAVGAFSGTGYLGSKVAVTARTIPGTSVFDYYIANGTTISFSAFGGGNLQNVLLSPNSNPFGATNPLGIYVIDCGGNTIAVSRLRVVGTLVLLNCSSASKIDQQQNFAPAVANYPTLMVKGSITLQYDTTALTEASSRNYNPPGTPYNGVSNSTQTDSYPSVLNGLVYISGNATLKYGNNFGGPLIVGGTVTTDQVINVTYDSTYLNNPPPGFFDPPPMTMRGSSVQQVVSGVPTTP